MRAAFKYFALICGALSLMTAITPQSVRAVDDSEDSQEEGDEAPASQAQGRVKAAKSEGRSAQDAGKSGATVGKSDAGAGQSDGNGGQSGEGNDITFLHDVEYGKAGDHVLHVEIAMPAAKPDKPMPAVVFFHPGGFVEGTHKKFPTFLAHKGYFVASVEYRFSNEAPFPAQLQDGQLAVRWLRANAKKYGVDPNRIAAWGASAGAVLAQWLGTMRHSDGFPKVGAYPDVDDSVKAVVSLFGSSDATLGYRLGKTSAQHKNAEALQGCTYKENPERYKKNSAITYVRSDDPPFFLLQGELDTTAIPEQGIEMDKALTAAKVPHELIIVKNCGHMWKHPKDGPALEPKQMACRHRAVAFLDQYLKDK
jgi:acetyl esterase/lipase